MTAKHQLLYRIWSEAERVHESLGYQMPYRYLTDGASYAGFVHH